MIQAESYFILIYLSSFSLQTLEDVMPKITTISSVQLLYLLCNITLSPLYNYIISSLQLHYLLCTLTLSPLELHYLLCTITLSPVYTSIVSFVQLRYLLCSLTLSLLHNYIIPSV